MWRAAQLITLLIGAELDAGPGASDARWASGTTVRSIELASRGGISVNDVETAIDRLLQVGVLVPDAAESASGSRASPGRDGLSGIVVRVASEYVSDGPAAAIAWSAVTEHLEGSAAALLVARALADHVERPGRPIVVPYSALASRTRYSEGMVKRGIAASIAAGVVRQRPSPGRAPAYEFSDWALGRAAAPGDRRGSPLSPEASGRRAPAASHYSEHVPGPPTPRGIAPVAGVLRASIAGVNFEIPAASGGELVVETVVDGRPVTARLILPGARQ